jgi:hypothetical protein
MRHRSEEEDHQIIHELHELRELVEGIGAQIMAAIDDLNTSVTNLTTVVDQAVTALTTDQSAAIATAVTNIDAQTNKLSSALGSVPPPA